MVRKSLFVGVMFCLPWRVWGADVAEKAVQLLMDGYGQYADELEKMKEPLRKVASFPELQQIFVKLDKKANEINRDIIQKNANDAKDASAGTKGDVKNYFDNRVCRSQKELIEQALWKISIQDVDKTQFDFSKKFNKKTLRIDFLGVYLIANAESYGIDDPKDNEAFKDKGFYDVVRDEPDRAKKAIKKSLKNSLKKYFLKVTEEQLDKLVLRYLEDEREEAEKEYLKF